MPRIKDFVGLDFHEALAAVRGGPPSSAFYGLPQPHELLEVYSRGFQGVQPNRTPETRKKFGVMIQAMPRLYEAFPWAKDIGKGKLNAPFTAIQLLDPEWGGDDAQERGDCTVHGTAHAAAIDYGIDCIFGETKYKGRLACENIYRTRGYNGDGWDCQSPTYYIGPEGPGGLLYRQVWKDPSGSDSVDLSRYNSSWEGNGRSGVPKWMETESAKNKAKWIILITTPEEYRDALAMGFGINVCSSQGFSSSTDENGVSRAQGAWSHAMGHTACDDREWAWKKYGNMLGGIQQSWGNWNTINGKPPDSPPMPTGMFYAEMDTIASRMLSGEDSFAICGVWGWDRSSWEAFVAADYKEKLLQHLRGSTPQDYYKQRSEKLAEKIKEVSQTNLFMGA